MTSIRHAALAGGLVALLALGGCGNNDVTKGAGAKKDTGSSSKAGATYPTQAKTACEVLTQEVAKSLLGGVSDESSPVRDTGNADVRVSTCVRTTPVADLHKAQSVSLLMRVAKSETGATSNEAVFGPGSLPKRGQDVSGYGEKAFWNPDLGQLNILNEGNWYVLASGPIDPKKHTLTETEKLADAILDRL
ncbi:MAG: hypothetical protein ABIR34_11435 [Marmoricola sp.]